MPGVGTGAGAGTNNNKKPHDHALASILGPAFVAAVAYVDPGNVAANITSGARYGYLLVWVLVLANAMSVLIQYQSAKLGIVTNKSLPELLGERMSDAGRFMFFMQAEVIAIATDLAEVIGGAIALNLLFGLPLFIGGLVIGTISTVMLWFQGGKTQTTFERIIIVMLLIITFGFIAGLFVAPPNPGEVVKGMIPRFQGADSVLMGRLDSGRHRDAARHLPALHAGERPLRRRRKAVNQNATERLENRCGLGAVAGRHRESGDAGARRQLAAWHVWHGFHRRAHSGRSRRCLAR